MDLDQIKLYLKVDIDEDNDLINGCANAAIAYLKNATGIDFNEECDNELAKIFILQLIADMYEKRTPSVTKDAGYVYQSMLLQLGLEQEA